MARSKHENLLIDAWLKMYSRHQNPIWATEELEWTVLVKHYYDFEKLNKFEQWEIRNMIGAFSKLYK